MAYWGFIPLRHLHPSCPVTTQHVFFVTSTCPELLRSPLVIRRSQHSEEPCEASSSICTRIQ